MLAYKVFPYTCLKLTFSITSSCVPFKSYRLCVKWCDIIIISLYKLAEVLVSYPGSQLGEGEGEPSISCGGGLATRSAREGGGLILDTRPSRFSACNIEKLGVAWGRGYTIINVRDSL